jgi:hypothetical protein
MDVANSLARAAGSGINIIEAACHNAADLPSPVNRLISVRIRSGIGREP